MTAREIAAHVVGVSAVAGAGAWLYLDVRPDGHVELSTAAGVSALALIGGFLIDKDRTAQGVAFLAAQLRQFFTLPTPKP